MIWELIDAIVAFFLELFSPRPKPVGKAPKAPPSGKAPKAEAKAKPRRSSKAQSPEQQLPALVKALPTIGHRGPGFWKPEEQVRIEEGRLAIDLHGLADEDAVEVVDTALKALRPPLALRLITGHGRDRELGYSKIRVALVEWLDGRAGVVVEDLEQHRRHRMGEDRLGHMDLRLG